MQSSLEKLRKFFRLEHENGYANTAVIGGLANILNFWEGEARNDNLPEEILQAVSSTLRGYAEQTREARAEALKSLWKMILLKAPEPVRTSRQTPPRAPRPPVKQVEQKPTSAEARPVEIKPPEAMGKLPDAPNPARVASPANVPSP